MGDSEIQELCERGQRELIATDYLAAVDTFVAAERAAWQLQSFDTLARLYLPLQEARRQVRQRCGEGKVRLTICSLSDRDHIDPQKVLEDVPHGQLLLAGWGSLTSAVELRRLAHEQRRYVETFLGAAYLTIEGKPVIAVVPLEDAGLPNTQLRDVAALRAALPVDSLLIPLDELPQEFSRGTTESFAIVMALWERLHRPFMEAADRETDPVKKMQAYRLTLRVDPACELAHQKLADVARLLARSSH